MTTEKTLSGTLRALRGARIMRGEELADYQRAATGCFLPTTQSHDGRFMNENTERMRGIWTAAIEWACRQLDPLTESADATAAQPLDLDKLTLYGFREKEWEDPSGQRRCEETFGEMLNGDYVKRSDVAALIAQARAAQPASSSVVSALRDLLRDCQAGVFDGDAARDAQALLDKIETDSEGAADTTASASGEPVAWLRHVTPDDMPDWPWPFTFVVPDTHDAMKELLEAFPVYRAPIPTPAQTGVVDERALFDAWYAKRHPEPVNKNPTWAHASKCDDWEVWQARASIAPVAAQQAAAKAPMEQAVDFSQLQRYGMDEEWEYRSIYPRAWGEFVKLAEVQALIAASPASTPEASPAEDPEGKFALGMMSQLHRMGASPAALGLAAQLFGVGPCPKCNYRKLHCRCTPEESQQADTRALCMLAAEAAHRNATGGKAMASDQVRTIVDEVLASQQVEAVAAPIYQFSSLGEKNWSDCTKAFYDDCPKYKYHRRIVYTAPTAAAATTSADARDAAKLDGTRIFEIAAPYFAWNAESWHKATQGTVGMPQLLEFTRAAIDAAMSAPNATQPEGNK